MELLKLLSANEIIAQTFCFLILLAILRKFMWKPFLALLDARKERIESEFKKIDETKAQVEQLKDSYDKKLADIHSEAQVKISEAIAEGRQMADKIREKAELESAEVLENAKSNIKVEIAKAREELKDTIVNLTIDVAEKVIAEKLTEADDRKIVGDFLKSMGDKNER